MIHLRSQEVAISVTITTTKMRSWFWFWRLGWLRCSIGWIQA